MSKRYIDAQTLAERYFDPSCRPDHRTIRSWVRNGDIEGKEIGRKVYIDEVAFVASTGDALFDHVNS